MELQRVLLCTNGCDRHYGVVAGGSARSIHELKLAWARGQRANLRRLLVRQLDANRFFLGCMAEEMGVEGRCGWDEGGDEEHGIGTIGDVGRSVELRRIQPRNSLSSGGVGAD
jgi:hypothetical protein